MCDCVFASEKRTLIPAQLNVSKQTDLNDLPEETEHQMRFTLPQVQSADIHHMTTNGWGRVKSQIQILLHDTQTHKPSHTHFSSEWIKHVM